MPSNACSIENIEQSLPIASLKPCGLDVPQELIKPSNFTTTPSPTMRRTKISIIGTGNVGMAIAQLVLTQHLSDELALVALNPGKLRGEMLDLQHAAAFLPKIKITSSVDYSITAGSDICIITAGARMVQGESRMDLCDRNVAIFKNIIPLIAKHSPDTILVIATNPVDVLTYVAWKLSGFPHSRVIGSGTNVDSSRMRFLIAEQLDVDAHDVQAYVIGEHGDTCVPVWSGASVRGVTIPNLLKERETETAYEETLKNIGREVKEVPLEVFRLKGYTSWAIAHAVANITQAIIRDQRSTHPVSVLAKGFHGISGGDVFLSLLAQLGRDGVIGVTNLPLNDEEAQLLLKSAKFILDVQNKLGL